MPRGPSRGTALAIATWDPPASSANLEAQPKLAEGRGSARSNSTHCFSVSASGLAEKGPDENFVHRAASEEGAPNPADRQRGQFRSISARYDGVGWTRAQSSRRSAYSSMSGTVSPPGAR